MSKGLSEKDKKERAELITRMEKALEDEEKMFTLTSGELRLFVLGYGPKELDFFEPTTNRVAARNGMLGSLTDIRVVEAVPVFLKGSEAEKEFSKFIEDH
jgi:hypothetical protein